MYIYIYTYIFPNVCMCVLATWSTKALFSFASVMALLDISSKRALTWLCVPLSCNAWARNVATYRYTCIRVCVCVCVCVYLLPMTWYTYVYCHVLYFCLSCNKVLLQRSSGLLLSSQCMHTCILYCMYVCVCVCVCIVPLPGLQRGLFAVRVRRPLHVAASLVHP
jgi:hypothetical protein